MAIAIRIADIHAASQQHTGTDRPFSPRNHLGT